MGLSMGSFVHVNKSHIFGQIADPRKQAEAGLERGWRLWQGGTVDDYGAPRRALYSGLRE